MLLDRIGNRDQLIDHIFAILNRADSPGDRDACLNSIKKLIAASFSDLSTFSSEDLLRLFKQFICKESLVKNVKTLMESLKETNTNYYEILKKKLIKRYSRIYGVRIEQASFFFDLEKSFKYDSFEVGRFFNIFFEGNDIPKNYSDDCYHYIDIEFPCYLEDDGKIIALNLAGCKLSEVPKSIGLLKDLVVLNLAFNDLRAVPESIVSLKNLKYLSLSSNLSLSVTDPLIELSKMEMCKKYVRMGVRKEEAFIIGILEILTGYLFGQEDKRSEFECELDYHVSFRLDSDGSIIGIYIFGIYNFCSWLSIFPEQICELKSIQDIILPSNDINVIPRCIEKLSFLKSLALSFNTLDKNPWIQRSKILRNICL